MTKTLKDLLEVYKPKAKGEQRFADKHVVVKHKDKNGNGDDVFNASNVKSIDKSPEHGYNAGEDEAVYEDIDHDDGWYTHHELYGKISKENWKKGWRYNHTKKNPFFHTKTKTWHSKIDEEYLQELSKKTLGNYIEKAYKDLRPAKADPSDPKQFKNALHNLKRYTGIRKADEKLKEENIQELDRHGSLSRYINKTKYDDKRKSGRDLALKKKWGDSNYGLPEPKVKGVDRIKEDTDLHELSKKTLASYINKAAVKNLAHAGSLATQAHDKDENKRKEAEGTAKKLVNKLDGIHRATKRLAKD